MAHKGYPTLGYPAPQGLIDYLKKISNGHAKTRPVEGEGRPIPEGSRDTRLTSMAGSMRRGGFDLAQVLEALRMVNESRCQPPLEASQVEKIARSICKHSPEEPLLVRLIKEGLPGKSPEPEGGWPLPVSMQDLVRNQKGNWLWEGYLARGGITLLSALWKSGKTTLVAGLLKALEGESPKFCGLAVSPSRVLYVTEESENRWAERRDSFGLAGEVHFLVRPYNSRPDFPRWESFVRHLGDQADKLKSDLIVIDTISRFWPVRDENDAGQVTEALMPFQGLSQTLAVLPIHHNRKGDGQEATASRGSGALTATVDTIIEFRRFNPADKKDRRRVLTGYGRWDETPEELVIEYTEDRAYRAYGDRKEVGRIDAQAVLSRLLPTTPPGLSFDDIKAKWPEDSCPRKSTVMDVLAQGVQAGIWLEEGEGKKGSPHTFWKRF